METINNNTRLIDLTVDDLVYVLTDLLKRQPRVEEAELPKRRLVYGIAGIAQLFNCSMTTANRIKASGKIDKAISQCGRIITVDADLALELMKI
jgi:hypothetical protein